MTRGDNASVSLILVFAWSAFSANCLSTREPAILPLRVIRIQPPLHLDARGMNSHVPLLSLDPSADDVSYAPVLHGVKFGSKAAAEQCAAALDEARRLRRTSPSCQS
jgi:hypothetical protein